MNFNHLGIQHLWAFEKNIKDSVGEADGVNNNMEFTLGKIKNGLYAKGNNEEYIDLGYINVHNNYELSISCWIKLHDLQNKAYIIDKPNCWSIFISSGKLIIKFGNRKISSTHSLKVDVWYFIILLYDGISLELYINNELEKTINFVSDVPIDNNLKCFVANSITKSFPFKGIIDELSIYNKALTLNDRNILYRSGKGVLEPDKLKEIGISINKKQFIKTKLSLPTNNSFSLSFWTFIREFDNGILFRLDVGEILEFRTKDIINNYTINSNDFIAKSYKTWVNWNIIYNSNACTMKVYMNGKIICTNPYKINGIHSLCIGACENGSQSLNFSLYDFRIYSRCISMSEIKTIFYTKGNDNIIDKIEARWFIPLSNNIKSIIPNLITQWNTGYSIANYISLKKNTIFILTIGCKDIPTSEVIYGGISMKKINNVSISSYNLSMWYLLDDDLTLTTDNIIRCNNQNGCILHHAIFDNIDQNDPIKIFSNNTINNSKKIDIGGIYADKNNLIITSCISGAIGYFINANNTQKNEITTSTKFTMYSSYKLANNMTNNISISHLVASKMLAISVVLNNVSDKVIDLSPYNRDIIPTNKPNIVGVCL